MGRKGGRGREPVARFQYLSPEQFRELTGRDPDPLPLPETRSQVLVLAPSEGDGWPVRFGDPVFVEATQEDLARLRVSAALIERLRAWGEAWVAGVDIGADPREAAPGGPLSVRLARQLQAELPAFEVFLQVGGQLRAARDLPV